ncbi:hypothetical protein HNV12_02500 [Methanococcoides sp. SA1]|nr:hypothetical protein [Methanococcoides sp. SA1]
MEMKELLDFIRKQNGILDNRYYEGYSDRSKALERVLKVNEEFGELCDEILKKNGSSRKGESDNEISHEVADVLICVLLLADSLNVDIEKGLEEKVAKIKKRFAEEWNEN